MKAIASSPWLPDLATHASEPSADKRQRWYCEGAVATWSSVIGLSRQIRSPRHVAKHLSFTSHSACEAMTSLSVTQQLALEQLHAVTASTKQAARERDERILRDCGWNVQVGPFHAMSSR